MFECKSAGDTVDDGGRISVVVLNWTRLAGSFSEFVPGAVIFFRLPVTKIHNYLTQSTMFRALLQ